MRMGFKDFSGLQVIIFLVGAGLVILWGFLVIGGYQLAVIDLPSTTPLTKISWVAILLQFLFNAIAFVGVLKYALLKIEYGCLQEQLDNTNDFLKKKLEIYEPEEEDNYRATAIDGEDHIHYYLGSTESLSALLPKYLDKSINFYSTSLFNNHIKTESLFFLNGILKDKTISVSNLNNRTICFQKLEIISNSPILGSTEKSYYDNFGELKYSFDYSNDGSCFMIIYEQEFGNDILAANIGLPDVSFTWQGFEYYQYANPVIPS